MKIEAEGYREEEDVVTIDFVGIAHTFSLKVHEKYVEINLILKNNQK